MLSPDPSASSVTNSITSADGTPLLVRRWSAGRDRWAQMLLVHGLAEHSGRYERTGQLLAEAGIDVTAFDLRGHGGSGGRRGDVERWTDYLDDIAVRLSAVRAEADGRPVVLFAHSYGGLISTDYVLSGRPAPDLLVLSAPALDDGLPRWQHVLVPLIARIWPTLAFKNAWGPDVLSRDPDVGRRARLDPGSPDRATVRMARSDSPLRNASGRRSRRWPCQRSCSTARTIASCHPRRPSRSSSCLASHGGYTRGFGTRRSTSLRARRSSPTSSPGCARRWTGGRPSRSHARGVADFGGKIRTYDQAVNSRRSRPAS